MRSTASRSLPILVALTTAAMLSACAELKLGATGVKGVQRAGESGSRGLYKVGDPYQINGVWYYPAENFQYAESGIASFYGGESSGVDFHGRRTANGEVYDMSSLTAAHQTLPMPSLVRVTNLDNGRQMVLRVNDRGPFVQGRIIDVSRRSAQLLGFEQRGTARVRVEILADESRQLKAELTGQTPPSGATVAAVPRTGVASESLPPPAGARQAAAGTPLPPPSQTLPSQPVPAGGGRALPPPPAPITTASAQVAALPPEQQSRAVPMLVQTPVRPTTLWVQAGAFTSYENAAKLGARLQRYGTTQITQVQSGTQQLYRVRVGPAQSVPDADRLLTDVTGVAPGARIMVD